MVKRISQQSSELSVQVRFLVGAPMSEKVRVGRIELPSSDWQPDVLPLNHTRAVRHDTTTPVFFSSMKVNLTLC